MFEKIKDYIEKNNIFINHYCTPDNIEQVSEFITTKNIKVFPLNEIPNNKKIINLWIGSDEYDYNNYSIFNDSNKSEPYNDFLLNFYNNVLKRINIPITIDNFIFDNDEELFDREKNINERTQNKYKKFDFLFINGAPRSGQLVNYNEKEWDDIIKRFSEKYDVITTKKIEGIKCTRDDNLTIKDISAISKNAKKIITINTGPIVGLYNKHVIDNVESVYCLCDNNNCEYSFPNFIYKRNISDILFLLNENKPLIESMVDRIISKNNYIFYSLLLIIFIIVIFVLVYKSFTKKIYNKLCKLIRRFV
jgi:hypothetical protein